MNEVEQTIFNRVAGFGVDRVYSNRTQREDFDGLAVFVENKENVMTFFFPDYAGMTPEEMGEVVANNMRMENWNSLMP